MRGEAMRAKPSTVEHSVQCIASRLSLANQRLTLPSVVQQAKPSRARKSYALRGEPRLAQPGPEKLCKTVPDAHRRSTAGEAWPCLAVLGTAGMARLTVSGQGVALLGWQREGRRTKALRPVNQGDCAL